MKKSLHILAVESAAPRQLVYHSLLQRAGHALSQATTAAEGLEMFQSRRPDAVILDLGLPDGNGLELMAGMRAIDADVPVVVTTANGSMTMAIEAMRAGAADFLIKPVDEQRLLAALEGAVLAARGAGDAPDRGTGGQPAGFIGTSPAMQEVYRPHPRAGAFDGHGLHHR